MIYVIHEGQSGLEEVCLEQLASKELFVGEDLELWVFRFFSGDIL